MTVMGMRSLFKSPAVRMLALGAGLAAAGLAVSGCSSREERAQAYYESGKSYLDKKDYAKARLEFRNALQRKGDLLEAWQGLAEIDEHDRNIAGLAGTLRKIVELAPQDISATTKLARIYLLGNAPDQALKFANAAGEIEPKNADVLALKSAILFKLKDIDGATRAASDARAIDPHNTGANAALAAIKLSQGDTDGASKALSAIPQDRTDDLGVVFLKLNIFNNKGDLAQVEALLRRLIELHPDVAQFRTQLVQFYLQHKRTDDAVNELRAVVTANPADSSTELELVSLLAAVKGPEAARAELLARINAGPNPFTYQIALARFDLGQGKADDSIKLLQQLVAAGGPTENTLVAKDTLAAIYLGRNDIAAAEPLINQVLAADSRNTTGLRLRASIRLIHGQVDDAIVDLRSALNDQPHSPELLAGLAAAYERNGSIDLAGKAYFDAMKASGYSPVAGLGYVTFLERRGQAPQAESVLNDLATRNPNSVPVLSALARVKLARQDWAGAHALAGVIKKLDSKSDVASQIDAAAFSGQGKFTDSLALLQGSYTAHPGATRPMVDLVRAYLQAGQTGQAETFIRSVLADNPANAEALVLMGTVQLTKNAPAEAEKYFKAAIEKKPADPAGYSALADLYARQKKSDDALNLVRAGLKQQPDNFALRLALAGLLEAKREYEPAIAEYEAMLKEQPWSLIIANNLASLLTDHRTDKASLERANSLALLLKSSDIPQFKDTLGWVTYQRQDYRTAVRLLEDAAKALPNIAMVRFHLGMSYLATGQDDKAADQFKAARKLAPNDAELGAKIDAALKDRPEKAKG
jgi:tetratricopeptide (TPR) repeat protein